MQTVLVAIVRGEEQFGGSSGRGADQPATGDTCRLASCGTRSAVEHQHLRVCTGATSRQRDAVPRDEVGPVHAHRPVVGRASLRGPGEDHRSAVIRLAPEGDGVCGVVTGYRTQFDLFGIRAALYEEGHRTAEAAPVHLLHRCGERGEVVTYGGTDGVGATERGAILGGLVGAGIRCRGSGLRARLSLIVGGDGGYVDPSACTRTARLRMQIRCSVHEGGIHHQRIAVHARSGNQRWQVVVPSRTPPDRVDVRSQQHITIRCRYPRGRFHPQSRTWRTHRIVADAGAGAGAQDHGDTLPGGAAGEADAVVKDVQVAAGAGHDVDGRLSAVLPNDHVVLESRRKRCGTAHAGEHDAVERGRVAGDGVPKYG